MTADNTVHVIAENASGHLGQRVHLTSPEGTKLDGRLIGYTKRVKDDGLLAYPHQYGTYRTAEITLELDGGYTITVLPNYSVRVDITES